jgi:hypothetical protein
MTSDELSQATVRAATMVGAVNHMIMGGAVNGRRTYGRFPVLAVNGPDDTNTDVGIPEHLL